MMTDTIDRPETLEDHIMAELRFRHQHDEVEIGGINRGGLPTARIKDPMRIDKFLRANTINEHQYAAGYYFSCLYAYSHKSDITLSAYDGMPKDSFSQRIFRELGIIGKVAASDLYHKIFCIMTPHRFRVAFQVCINEMSVDDLARCFQIRRKNMPTEIRISLNELGDKTHEAQEAIIKDIDTGKAK